MPKHRIYFSKNDTAKYISHLDLMGTFQRAFLRAEIPIRHTEGFNPHAFVSIPLPMSVGFSSGCEVLECELLGVVDFATVPERMNSALPAGITVSRCSVGTRPVKDLCYVNYIITMEYESGAPFGAESTIRSLLSRESLVVSKKSKKAKAGQVEVDLIPLIAKATVEERRDSITIDAVLQAQNPGLNPVLIVSAIRSECPVAAPDFASFHRRAVQDASFRVWE